MGLINHCVAPEDLDATINEIVNDLLAGEPHAIAVAKQLALQSTSHSHSEAFARMSQLSNGLFASEEALEGMTAYLEKRPAAWVSSFNVNPEK